MQQLNLLSEMGFETESDWTNDDWQTPGEIASLMAGLVKDTDQWILEPCAGNGQICKAVDKAGFTNFVSDGIAIELNSKRYKNLESVCLNWQVYCFDFLTEFRCGLFPLHPGFDLIITNPPFSKCVEFIERSLQLLNPNNPESRLLFLLPLDWNCTQERAKQWSKLNAHIYHVYRIKGRVAYLDASGVPQKGRQCCDAVFDIRPGKLKGGTSYLDE